MAPNLTDPCSRPTELAGRIVDLETIPEIIAKKIRFRGSSIQPRDIFDVAAASEAGYEEEITAALAEFAEYRDIAANRLDHLNDDYVLSVIAQLMLKPEFEATAINAIAVTRRLLSP